MDSDPRAADRCGLSCAPSVCVVLKKSYQFGEKRSAGLRRAAPAPCQARTARRPPRPKDAPLYRPGVRVPTRVRCPDRPSIPHVIPHPWPAWAHGRRLHALPRGARRPIRILRRWGACCRCCCCSWWWCCRCSFLSRCCLVASSSTQPAAVPMEDGARPRPAPRLTRTHTDTHVHVHVTQGATGWGCA